MLFFSEKKINSVNLRFLCFKMNLWKGYKEQNTNLVVMSSSRKAFNNWATTSSTQLGTSSHSSVRTSPLCLHSFAAADDNFNSGFSDRFNTREREPRWYLHGATFTRRWHKPEQAKMYSRDARTLVGKLRQWFLFAYQFFVLFLSHIS